MTTPTPTTTEVPAVDPGNQFVLTAAHPVQLVTSDLQTSIGKLAALTMRTAGTTLSVLLTPEQLDEWIGLLQARRDAMTGLTIIREPVPRG